MHRLYSEFVCEPEGGQVEIAVDKAVEAEFCLAVFACLMVHHFLANTGESGVFCQIGDVAVHVAVHLYALYHFVAVGLQTAVEVMEIVDSAHSAGGGVEQFGGDGLRQRVVAFLFPSAHKVIALLGNHAVEFRDFIGAVLQVGVHGYHHIAFGAAEAGVQGR